MTAAGCTTSQALTVPNRSSLEGAQVDACCHMDAATCMHHWAVLCMMIHQGSVSRCRCSLDTRKLSWPLCLFTIDSWDFTTYLFTTYLLKLAPHPNRSRTDPAMPEGTSGLDCCPPICLGSEIIFICACTKARLSDALPQWVCRLAGCQVQRLDTCIQQCHTLQCPTVFPHPFASPGGNACTCQASSLARLSVRSSRRFTRCSSASAAAARLDATLAASSSSSMRCIASSGVWVLLLHKHTQLFVKCQESVLPHPWLLGTNSAS
jgi:hypothetical protein